MKSKQLCLVLAVTLIMTLALPFFRVNACVVNAGCGFDNCFSLQRFDVAPVERFDADSETDGPVANLCGFYRVSTNYGFTRETLHLEVIPEGRVLQTIARHTFGRIAGTCGRIGIGAVTVLNRCRLGCCQRIGRRCGRCCNDSSGGQTTTPAKTPDAGQPATRPPEPLQPAKPEPPKPASSTKNACQGGQCSNGYGDSKQAVCPTGGCNGGCNGQRLPFYRRR